MRWLQLLPDRTQVVSYLHSLLVLVSVRGLRLDIPATSIPSLSVIVLIVNTGMSYRQIEGHPPKIDEQSTNDRTEVFAITRISSHNRTSPDGQSRIGRIINDHIVRNLLISSSLTSHAKWKPADLMYQRRLFLDNSHQSHYTFNQALDFCRTMPRRRKDSCRIAFRSPRSLE